jgi:predicted Zn-dependent protease
MQLHHPLQAQHENRLGCKPWQGGRVRFSNSLITSLQGTSVLLVVVAVGLLAARAEEPKAVRPVYNSFSDEEEMAMGSKAAAQTEKQLRILEDKLLETYLDHVGQKLAQASRRPQLQYHFKVVDKSSVNAFSLPGGYVYVNRGLLDFVENESELAGVLGHEIGHVVAYHSMNDVARRMLVDRLMYEGKRAGFLNDQQVQDVLQRYGGPILLFVDRKFSREEESEADLLGLYNTLRAGWDPEGLVSFLTRLRKFSANPDLVQSLLLKHPLPLERVQALRNELQQHPPSGDLRKDSFLFTGARMRLKSLSPPK